MTNNWHCKHNVWPYFYYWNYEGAYYTLVLPFLAPFISSSVFYLRTIYSFIGILVKYALPK